MNPFHMSIVSRLAEVQERIEMRVDPAPRDSGKESVPQESQLNSVGAVVLDPGLSIAADVEDADDAFKLETVGGNHRSLAVVPRGIEVLGRDVLGQQPLSGPLRLVESVLDGFWEGVSYPVEIVGHVK